jgi:uncharacterized membrane protein YkoI
MKNNLFAILVSMAALAPAGAMADIGEPAGAAQNKCAADDAQKMIRQLFELSRQTQVSLHDAIAVAEKRHDGSRTVQIGFDRSAFPCYRVRTVRNDEIWENTIDAKTGRITGVERVLSFQKLGSEDRTNIKAIKHITQGMSEAVLVAERVVPGMAVGGCLIDDSVTLHFVVLVVSGDRLKQVMLEVDRHATASRNPILEG